MKKSESLVTLKDLSQIWRAFRQNWYILVIALLLSGLAAYLYTYKMPNIYGARTQILLKSGETYDYQAGIFKNVGYLGSYENIANQQRILSSYNLFDKVISKLNMDVSYFIVGRFKTSEVYNAMPFHVEVHYVDPMIYQKPINLDIENENKFNLSYEFNGEVITGSYAFDSNVKTKHFFVRVIKNELLDRSINTLKDIEYQFVINNKPYLVNKYRSAMTIENLEYTTVLQLNLNDEIPSRAVAFLDTLSQEYINYTLQSQIDINERTMVYIDRQLDEVVRIMTGIEDDLQEFRSSKAILNLSKEEDAYFEKLIEFDNRRRVLLLQMQSIESLENYIRQNQGVKDDRLLPPSVFIDEDDAFLQKNINELYNLQLSRNTSLYTSTDNSPAIIQVDEKIELLKKDILIYLFNLKQAIGTKISDVEDQVEEYTALIRGIPKTQRGLLEINRQLQVNEKMYLYLLEKKANTIIARAGIIPETKVIETARSVGVVLPNKSRIFRMFLLAGSILGLGVIAIRFLFFSRIETIEDLKEIATLPILGEIIDKGNGKDTGTLVVESSPKSPITESFRALRTNLEYVVNDKECRTILITSHSPGEGKTFCSINLAAILAKAGKRVLLLEMDLHKPKIRKDLKMEGEHEPGVSSVLAGINAPEDVIKRNVYEGLDIMLAGPTPPNASELIMNERLNNLLAFGRANYDYVIIDTAPIGLITDAVVLMKHVDTTLFILNVKVARKEYVHNVEELVATHGIKKLGFVINGVKLKKSRYYYNYSYGYKYGYSYGYGYGYGNPTQSKKAD